MVSCGNILYLSEITSPSHHLWNRVLVNGLAEKGFNVTMLSVDNDKNPGPNIHYIHLEGAYKAIYESEVSMNLREMADQQSFQRIKGMNDWLLLNCQGVYKSKGLDIILNYPDSFKFDALIYDFTGIACLLPLLHKFNYPPLIAVSPFDDPVHAHSIMGGKIYPAYVPHYVTEYAPIMNFRDRIVNTLLFVYDTM